MSKLSFLNYRIDAISEFSCMYDYSMLDTDMETKCVIMVFCCTKSDSSNMNFQLDRYVIHNRIIYKKYQVYQGDTGIFNICFGACMAIGDDDMFKPGTEFRPVKVKIDTAIEVLENNLIAFERNWEYDKHLYMPYRFIYDDTYHMPVDLISRLEIDE